MTGSFRPVSTGWAVDCRCFAFGMLGALVVTSVASAIELGFGSPDRTLIAMVIPGLVVLWVGAIAAWLAARPHA